MTSTTKVENELTEKKRTQWINDIGAYLDDDKEVTEYGRSKIKVVKFKDEEASLSLLKHVWNEYDIYAESTLKWLYELGKDSNFEVRLRVAAVAGQLAIQEFRPVREQIISPWAKSNNQTLQRLSALALAVVAYDQNEEIYQQAINLLNHWSNLKKSYSLHWTAIAAYGGHIGLIFPEQALDNLKIIVKSNDGSLFPDVAQAVANLFYAGEQVSNSHLIVFNALKEWTEEENKETSVHQLSLLIFWGLVHDSWSLVDNIYQPTILRFAKQNQTFEELVIHLVKEALNLEFSRDLILPEIFEWMQFVDQNQVLYKTLARIIFSLASSNSSREKERVCNYLNRWSRKSKSATQILNLIKRHT